MSVPLLAMRGVGKRYAAVRALRDVDLEIQPGQSVAVLGPNGAGKSTLLRIMAGLAHATEGELEFAGGRPDRGRVGYLGHATLLYPKLTARENLLFAGRLYGVSDLRARADRLLEEEGLADVAERRAGGFSRGMAQRLSIARARVHDPELLLLDEPFSGLDEAAAARLGARLEILGDAGHTLVFSTHEIGHAARLAGSALVLVAGAVERWIEGNGMTESGLRAEYAQALEANP